MESERVQNTHNSLDVLADSDVCLRIVGHQHVFVFSKHSPTGVNLMLLTLAMVILSGEGLL